MCCPGNSADTLKDGCGDPVEAREIARGEWCRILTGGEVADPVADGLGAGEVVHAGLDAADGGSVPSNPQFPETTKAAQTGV